MTACLFHTPSLLVFVYTALIRIIKHINFGACLATVDNLKKYIKGIEMSSFMNKVIHCDLSLRMPRTLAVMCLFDYFKLV